MAGAFGEHGLEPQLIYVLSDLIGVDKLCVAESLGSNSEILLDGFLVFCHLMLELLGGSERSERVVVGLAEKLHASGLGEGPEAVYHLGSIAVELLKNRAGDAEGELNLTLGALYGFQKKLIHREIALLSYPFEYGPVRKVIIVMGILTYIEEAILTESGRLMDLKIQAN